jgi:RNA polymerase sigma-70 factor, ECF subfamily
VQEAFVKVWKHWDRYREDVKFTTWLYKIVWNLSIDHLRAGARHKTEWLESGELNKVIWNGNSTEESLDQVTLAGYIRKISRNLPEKQQLVFTLRDLQDLEMDEVCEISGMTAAQVKSNLCLARKFIREKLNKIGISNTLEL